MRHVAVGVLVVVVRLAAMSPVSAREDASEPLVSVLFYETDLREALAELVLLTGVNIIVMRQCMASSPLT